MELARAVSEFLDHCAIEEGFSPSTVSTYRQVLQVFVRFAASLVGEQVTVQEVDRLLVRRFQRYLAVERALDDETYVKYCSVLRSFATYLRENGLASLSRDDVRLPKSYLDLSKVKALALDDLLALLQAPDRRTPWGLRDRAILATLYSTGMRVGEICSLDREQIPEHRLTKEEVLELPIVGKGRKPRVVFLDAVAQQLLKEYLQARSDQYPALFIAYRGRVTEDARLTPRMIQAAIARYARAAGLSQRPTPHTLRHTFALHKLMAGADIRIVQAFLGHASLSTTQRYTRVTDSYLKEAYVNSHISLNLGPGGSRRQEGS
jgi:site-specific recombinase XerD